MSFPRRSVLSLTFGVPGVILLVGALTGALFVAVSGPEVQRGWRLQVEGQDAEGVVTGKQSWEESCGRNDLDTCTRYEIRYRFAQGAGQALVDAATYDGLAEGAAVRLRYVPADPATSELQAGETLIEGGALAGLGLVFALGCGLGLWLRGRKAARMLRLRETGTMRTATVTAREPTSVRINGRRQWVIRWTDSTGATGKSRLRRMEDLPEAGAALVVYADPDGVLPAVWEGDVGTR